MTKKRQTKPASAEVRNIGENFEIRADGQTGEGIVEGYVTVWNTVDDYRSTFQRGAFSKTIQERGGRIKVLWNHTDEVIGKLLEIREDDKGLFTKIKLIEGVQRGRETYELIKAGAIDTFSFGFRTIKDKYEQGVRVITEAALMEVSPVIFEANSNAVVTDVRKKENEQAGNPEDTRATDFSETDSAIELQGRRYRLLRSLDETLFDILYNPDVPTEELVGMTDKALSDFSSAYLDWTQEAAFAMSGEEMRSRDLLERNELAQAFDNLIERRGESLEELAAATSLTISEVRALREGKTIVAYDKLLEIDEKVFAAHQQIRSGAVESLCSELRAGINSAEAKRITALCEKSIAKRDEGFTGAVDILSKFTKSLKED